MRQEFRRLCSFNPETSNFSDIWAVQKDLTLHSNYFPDVALIKVRLAAEQ
jgi:hypothetical protein